MAYPKAAGQTGQSKGHSETSPQVSDIELESMIKQLCANRLALGSWDFCKDAPMANARRFPQAKREEAGRSHAGAPHPTDVPVCSLSSFSGTPAKIQQFQIHDPMVQPEELDLACQAEVLKVMSAMPPNNAKVSNPLYPKRSFLEDQQQSQVSHAVYGQQIQSVNSARALKAPTSQMWQSYDSVMKQDSWNVGGQYDMSNVGSLSRYGMPRGGDMNLPQKSENAAAPTRLVGIKPCNQQALNLRDLLTPPGLSLNTDMLDELGAPDMYDDDGSCDSEEPEVELGRLPPQIAHTGPKTTLMIRNIPVLYTQEMLLMEWPNVNTYDFLYLPFSCNMQRNLTYAFVNFTSEAAASNFKNTWQKMRLAHYMTRKPLNISYADLQGRDENLLQLKKKRFWRIKVKQCQPIIFENGERISLALALHRLGQ